MGILLGLGAALCWGVGDFVITIVARHVGTAKSLLYIQLFSFLFWISLIWVFPHEFSTKINPWMFAGVAGVFHVVGLAATYRAFEIGTLSFVSPIASSFAIVTTLMFVIAGKSPDVASLIGILLLVGGIVVVTRCTPSDGPVTDKGIFEAVLSAVGFGVMFWILDVHVKQPLGDVYPLILLKLMASIFAMGYVARTPKPETLPPKLSKVLALSLAAALCDTLAWICYLFGNNKQHAAIGTALASLFSVVTVILAGTFLKERLNKWQWLGVAVVIGGILIVSLPK
jgi:drug/metabolite transporter (DMT)-like permease